jgi:hypothetical protein
MMAFGALLRLAAVGSRTDRLRILLIALGAALGTVVALGALVVLAIDGYDDRYTNNLLKEPGLRPGVAVGCWLLLIPTLVFIGMCTRVCAERRERRYATLRLIGATPRQVRTVAASETALATLAGTLLGLGLFLVGRAALAARAPADGRLTLPVDEPLPLLPTALFCLLIPALAGLVAVWAMRAVVVGPLGVARRHRRGRPSGWPAVLLLGGPVSVLVADRTASGGGGGVGGIVVAGAALTCLGLLFASAWLSSIAGKVTARVTGRPAALIAARRLEADPHGQSWAMSSVVLCAFFAGAAAVLRAETLDSQRNYGGGGDFYARAYDLVNLGILLAAGVAAAGLLVALAEGIIERRRSLAALVAAGTPVATLRGAVLLQGLLPLVPAILLATALGAGSVLSLVGIAWAANDPNRISLAVPWADLAAVVGVGIAVTLAATALALPFLQRSVRPAELRFE